MTDEEIRLHEFILRLAEHLADAAAVLGHLAEKKRYSLLMKGPPWSRDAR